MSKGGKPTTQQTTSQGTTSSNSTGTQWGTQSGTQNGVTNQNTSGVQQTQIDPTIAGYRDQLWNMMGGELGQIQGSNGNLDQASGLFSSYAPYAAQGNAALAGDAAATQKYMNPYLDQVIGRVYSGADKLRAGAMGQVDDMATQARAFGGSRHGIAMGQALGDTNNHLLDSVAGLSYQGFNDAMGRAMGQAQMGLSAANGMAGIGATQLANDPAVKRLQLATNLFGAVAPYGNTRVTNEGNVSGTSSSDYSGTSFGGSSEHATGTSSGTQKTVTTPPKQSVLGGILGLGTTLMGIPGLGGWLGGKLGGLFGGGGGGWAGGGTPWSNPMGGEYL